MSIQYDVPFLYFFTATMQRCINYPGPCEASINELMSKKRGLCVACTYDLRTMSCERLADLGKYRALSVKKPEESSAWRDECHARYEIDLIEKTEDALLSSLVASTQAMKVVEEAREDEDDMYKTELGRSCNSWSWSCAAEALLKSRYKLIGER
jgi:hypothetical protein